MLLKKIIALLFKHRMLIFGNRRSYNTLDRADKLSTARHKKTKHSMLKYMKVKQEIFEETNIQMRKRKM